MGGYKIKLEERVINHVMSIIDKMSRLGFESREGQENLMLDCAEAILDKNNLVKEAAVGIGKSFGYLIPSGYIAYHSGKPIVIATSTISLQNQLVGDVEKVNDLTGLNLSCVIGKGQRNYVCLDRVFKESRNEYSRVEKGYIERILNHNLQDRSQSPEITERQWDSISVNHCKYYLCEFHEDCNYYNMRKEISTSFNNIIIVNQDLLIAHLLKQTSGGKPIIYPGSAAFIIDEAHNLEEKTRQALTTSWDLKSAMSLNQKMERMLSYHHAYHSKYKILIRELEIEIINMFNIFKRSAKVTINKKKDFEENSRLSVNYNHDVSKKLEILSKLNEGIQLSDYHNEYYINETLDDIYTFEHLLKNLRRGNDSPDIMWLDYKKTGVSPSVTLSHAPKNIDERLNRLLFSTKIPVILTSATLTQQGTTDEEKYRYLCKSIGFKGYQASPEPSPFPYNENARLFIPNKLTSPKEDTNKYLLDIAEYVYKLTNITEGRTIVLFTSKNDMEKVYDLLLNKGLSLNLLIQRDGTSPNELINQFRKEKGVLLGTGAFWEGINIEGPDLSSVIITRLPFPVPDPIIKYKMSVSASWMKEVLMPEMIIKLKQGAGRLIRTATDTGLLTILDDRLNTYGYRHDVIDALPIKNRITTLEEVEWFVSEKVKKKYKVAI